MVNHTGNNHGAGSRANSLEPVRPAMEPKHERHKEHRDEEEGALGVLAAAEHRRQRSIRYGISSLLKMKCVEMREMKEAFQLDYFYTSVDNDIFRETFWPGSLRCKVIEIHRFINLYSNFFRI